MCLQLVYPGFQDDVATLFLLDKKVKYCVPMYLQPELFRMPLYPHRAIQDLVHLLQSPQLQIDSMIVERLNISAFNLQGSKDGKRQSLIVNNQFTIKLFYRFLNHGGTQCPTTQIIWKCICPPKINLFYTSIPTLKIQRRVNVTCSLLPPVYFFKGN